MAEPCHTGRCACGRVAFVAEGEQVWAAWCHCSDCRRATGAPVALWVGFAKARVTWDGAPRMRPGRPMKRRGFCADCGAPLCYEDATIPGEMIWLAHGAFDAPETLVPMAHAFWGERMPWLAIDDGLPRYDTFSRSRETGVTGE